MDLRQAQWGKVEKRDRGAYEWGGERMTWCVRRSTIFSFECGRIEAQYERLSGSPTSAGENVDELLAKGLSFSGVALSVSHPDCSAPCHGSTSIHPPPPFYPARRVDIDTAVC